MNKTLISLIVAVLLAVIIGVAGGASYSVSQTIWLNMRADIRSNTDAVLSDVATDAQVVASQAMQAVIDHHANRAKQELSAHYTHQLEQISQHSAIHEAMAQIGPNTTALIAEEKARIDAVIAAILSGD